MEKTPRYTQRERNMVLRYAAQYKDVIENKRTDAESNRKKDEVWLEIAKEFNSRVYHQRSAKQLRQLYKNMKLLLKKDLCGEDKTNPSFMDLLNKLSQPDSMAQYISDQFSPDGAGGGGSGSKQGGAGNGNHGDDYDDSKVGVRPVLLGQHLTYSVSDHFQLPHYGEGMDTEVILIKSETISDNEQTDNGMDCLDDDDDDDCLSPKAPEVCLEEEDDVLFPTDLRQLQQVSSSAASAAGVGASTASLPGNIFSNGIADPVPRAASSPVCSTKTSASSSGSYAPGTPKPDITIQNLGHIRVGSFANINKTLQNGGTSSGGIASANGVNSNGVLSLTAEQVQQHTLLNGLGLSAVNREPQSLQAAINAATAFVSANNSSGVASSRGTPPTLQLPRLQRGNNNNNSHTGNTNNSSVSTNGVQLLLNGGHHHSGHQNHHNQHSQHAHQKAGGVAIGAAGSFNGYNGLAVVPCANLNTSSGSGSGGSSANSSGAGLGLHSASSGGGGIGANGSRSQQQELMNSLRIEESKRKIDLLNAQIEYWQTLTRKLNSQTGHLPNPACPCHFPGANALSPSAAGVGAGSSSSSVSASVLQSQASSS
ncbi:hypothetical protein KR074_006240 [Drosophila pseudoananassae]|nr:hypothetical protein KR074_006240 [Drosophila pseudoananassae]